MNVIHFPPPPKDPSPLTAWGSRSASAITTQAGRPQAAVLPDNVLFESGANWREHPLEFLGKGAALTQSRILRGTCPS
jgi:hypothetical protein